MIAAGIRALFMMARVPLSTSHAPLFHKKYPRPLAPMPSHSIAEFRSGIAASSVYKLISFISAILRNSA